MGRRKQRNLTQKELRAQKMAGLNPGEVKAQPKKKRGRRP